jgi:hypothetical protein
VALHLQSFADTFPAPAAVPRAVNEYERRHRSPKLPMCRDTS